MSRHVLKGNVANPTVKMPIPGQSNYLLVEKTTDTTDSAVEVMRLDLKTADDTTAADGQGQKICFRMEDDAGDMQEMARIEVASTDNGDASEDTFFKFYTKNAGTLANRLTVDSSGSLSGVGDLTFAADQDVTIIDNSSTAWEIKESSNSYMTFDTTDSAENILVSKNLKIANTIDIVPATGGGSDLGSTSAEWGTIYVGDSKGVYLGAGQDCSILHDGTTGLDIAIADNDTGALTIKESTNSYVTIDTGTNSEMLTLQSPQDVVVQCGATATDSLVLKAYDVGVTAYESMITLASHATLPTMTLAATGGITVSNAVSVANTMDITAATSGGSDLGSTTGEWGMIYVGDSKGLQLGADQDITLLHDGTSGLDLTLTSGNTGAFVIADGTQTYLTIDSSDEQIEVGQKVVVANTMDIIPATGGGSDLGSTSAEWGSIYVGDSKGVYWGADQDVSLVHDGGNGLTLTLPSDDAAPFTIADGTLTYLTIDSTDDQIEIGQKVLVANTMDILAATAGGCDLGGTSNEWGSVYVGDSKGLYWGADQDVSLLHDGTSGLDLTLKSNDTGALVVADGTDTFLTIDTSNAASQIEIGQKVEVANTMDIVAATSGGSDLGSTSGEWGTIYVGDSKGVQFGADQDATLMHDGTAGVDLTVADNNSGAFVVKESSNAYLTVDTTNSAENVAVNKPLKVTNVTVDMANAEHTMVFGAAGANETSITGNTWYVDPNGGAQILVLPAEANMSGYEFTIVNTADAAEGLTVQDDAKGYTVFVLDQNQAGKIVCNGTVIYGFMGSET